MGMFQKNHGKNLKVLQLLALPALAALAVIGMSQSSQAALVASDNAGNYTSSEWTGSNTAYDQGTGFQSWSITQSGTSGLFLASPSNNAGGPNNIVPPSGSNIWGVYANNGGSIQIDRSFTNAANTGVGKLDTGQTFSIALSSDGVDNSGSINNPYSIGFNLQSTGETSNYLFQMIFDGGGSDMQIYDGSGSYTLSSVPFSDLGTFSGDKGGIVANITIGSAVAGGGYNYSLAVTNATGTATYQTVSGRQTAAGAINQFQVFDSNAGSNLYFNNIAVAVPAPATVGLVLAGGIALAGMRMKRGHRNIQA